MKELLANPPVESSGGLAASKSRVASTPRAMRPVYFALGILFVALGYLGLVLPVMPGTIFFILALNFFRRSNERLEIWLLTRTRIGPSLRHWDDTGSIPPRVKAIILGVMWLSILGSVASAFRAGLSPVWFATAMVFLIGSGIGVSWYILTRPNR